MTTLKKKSWLRRLFYFFGVLIILSLLLRVFVFEIYKVSKNSMNNTYYDGDRVLVNKLAKKNIKRDDIAVFKYKDDVYIKRCIGLPGETVEIRKGIVFINNKKVPFPEKAILPQINISDTGLLSPEKLNVVMFDLFGKYWDSNNFGPYTIPEKGMTIQLTPENKKLYKRLIQGSADISTAGTFTFTDDYFFLIGDNRPGSEDSRIFGAIDKTKIIGTVSFSF